MGGDFTNAFGITTEAMTAAIPLGRMGVPQDGDPWLDCCQQDKWKVTLIHPKAQN